MRKKSVEYNQPNTDFYQWVFVMIVYSELQQIFERFNQMFEDCLGERLNIEDIIFTLQRKNKVLGYFNYKSFENPEGGFKHEISLNPEYFTVKPKIEILRVFCQELLQLYRIQFGDKETLKIGLYDEEWGEFMMVIGLMPSNTGKPDGKPTGKKMSSYVMPDGAFLKLCNEMAEDDLLIGWFDKIPAKYEMETLMYDLFELRDVLEMQMVHPSLIEIPILKRKNIDVLTFIECLELNKETKKIQFDIEKAELRNLLPQTKQPVELNEDEDEYYQNPTFPMATRKDEFGDRDMLSVLHNPNKLEAETFNINTKDKLAEIIGIEKPKTPNKKNVFKYACACSEVTSSKENLRFTCNSCTMPFRCETEVFENNVVLAD